MQYRNFKHNQRGITLTEALLVLALAALLASVAYVTYGSARKDVRVADITNGTISMVAKISQVYGNSSDYTSLTAQLLNQAGLVPSQFLVIDQSGTAEMHDAFGNPFLLSGTLGSYAFAFENLDSESCAKLAPALVSVAHQINTGNDVIINNGRIDGGHIYKSPEGEVNVANLAIGCNAAPTRLAVEVRS